MYRERSHTIHEDFFDPSMNTRRGLLSPGKRPLRKGTAGDIDDFSQFSQWRGEKSKVDDSRSVHIGGVMPPHHHYALKESHKRKTVQPSTFFKHSHHFRKKQMDKK